MGMSFRKFFTVSVTDVPCSILFSNFNGDGQYIIPGNGDGTFKAEVDLGYSSLWGKRIAVGDFNKDGRDDAVLTWANGTNHLIMNEGDKNRDGKIDAGDFTGKNLRSSERYSEVVKVGDLNGDGYLDLFSETTITALRTRTRFFLQRLMAALTAVTTKLIKKMTMVLLLRMISMRIFRM